MFRFGTALLALALATSAAAKPPVAAPAVVVGFGAGFAQPQSFSKEALAAFPRQQVEAKDHGTAARWDGVAMLELLRRAGAPLDKALRGAALGKCVVVHAADGYRVVFALAEFDTEFGNNGALLADRRDDKPLDAKEGPFRLVLPREQRAGRWVRQVNEIELTDCGLAPVTDAQ